MFFVDILCSDLQMHVDDMSVDILCSDFRDFRAKKCQKCVFKNRPEGGAIWDRFMLMG